MPGSILRLTAQFAVPVIAIGRRSPITMRLCSAHSSVALRRSLCHLSGQNAPSLGPTTTSLSRQCLSTAAAASRAAPASRRILLRPAPGTVSLTPRRWYSGCGCHGGATKSRAKTAYIALGSNLGDRVAEIEKACNEMDRRGIKVKRTSSLWETEPMYVTDQDRFINGACEVRLIANADPGNFSYAHICLFLGRDGA